MEYSFSDYRITSVYGQVNSELAEELVAFWVHDQEILDLDTAKQRAPEVVFIARNTAGQIIGVSTVYISTLRRDERYYFYRMFIRPGDRVFGMMSFMTSKTRDYLCSFSISDKPNGVAFVSENPKLMRPGMRRELERLDFTCIGKTPDGFDVWKSDF